MSTTSDLDRLAMQKGLAALVRREWGWCVDAREIELATQGKSASLVAWIPSHGCYVKALSSSAGPGDRVLFTDEIRVLELLNRSAASLGAEVPGLLLSTPSPLGSRPQPILFAMSALSGVPLRQAPDLGSGEWIAKKIAQFIYAYDQTLRAASFEPHAPSFFPQRRELPAFAAPLAPFIDQIYEEVERPCPVAPRITHADLHDGQIFVEGARQKLGILDFGITHKGDPHLSLSLLFASFGAKGTLQIMDEIEALNGGAPWADRARMVRFGALRLAHWAARTPDPSPTALTGFLSLLDHVYLPLLREIDAAPCSSRRRFVAAPGLP